MSGVNFCLWFVIVMFIPPIIISETLKVESDEREIIAATIIILWALAVVATWASMIFTFLAWWL